MMRNFSTAPGYVAPALGLPSATTGGIEYVFSWVLAQVRHVMVQNNTNQAINFEFDTTVNAGSPTIPAGQTFFFDVHCSAVHLLSASPVNINGSTGGNLIVRGWL